MFEAFGLMVTNDLFDLAHAVGDVDKAYADDVCEVIKDKMEEVKDLWLDDVFGHASRLENEDFLEKGSTLGSWIFYPAHLRTKILEHCEIEQVK